MFMLQTDFITYTIIITIIIIVVARYYSDNQVSWTYRYLPFAQILFRNSSHIYFDFHLDKNSVLNYIQSWFISAQITH